MPCVFRFLASSSALVHPCSRPRPGEPAAKPTLAPQQGWQENLGSSLVAHHLQQG